MNQNNNNNMNHTTKVKISSISPSWLAYVKAVNPESHLDLIVVTIHCLAASIKMSLQRNTPNVHRLVVLALLRSVLDGIMKKDITIEAEDADELEKRFGCESGQTPSDPT